MNQQNEEEPPRSRSELGRYVSPTPKMNASTTIELPPISTKTSRML